jgi:hypothetical protein
MDENLEWFTDFTMRANNAQLEAEASPSLLSVATADAVYRYWNQLTEMKPNFKLSIYLPVRVRQAAARYTYIHTYIHIYVISIYIYTCLDSCIYYIYLYLHPLPPFQRWSGKIRDESSVKQRWTRACTRTSTR